MQSLPNLIYIGPDKAGSTWLFKLFSQHPDVYVPPAKDLYFFDRYFHKGLTWYAHQFAGHRQERVVAEISHDYLYSRLAAKRLRAAIPKTRLLVCLREPVTRTFSAYLQMVKSGDYRGSFEQALAECPHLTEHSLYGKYLRRYLEYFPREQIHCVFFDDLQQSPQAFAHQLCAELQIQGVPLSKDLLRKALPASRSRSVCMTRLARKAARQVRQWGMPRLVGRVKSSPIVQKLLFSPLEGNHKPTMASATRASLRDFFSGDIELLDNLLDVNAARRWGFNRQEGRHLPICQQSRRLAATTH